MEGLGGFVDLHGAVGVEEGAEGEARDGGCGGGHGDAASLNSIADNIEAGMCFNNIQC